MSKYYTLFIKEAATGEWTDMFGSYKKADCVEEKYAYEFDPNVASMRVVATDGTEDGLRAAFRKLPHDAKS